ncbi:MAG: hypothetical protein SFW08_12665 [Gemmatimonadaceae bacterium]|nr:hypothetical protein [Gemmatimonadaceae bacterium]
MRSLHLLVAAVLLPAPLVAQAPLPTASAVLARYRAAVGADAAQRFTSLRSTGSFEMPAAGVKGSVVLDQAAPNKMKMTISVPGLGEIAQGFDGKTGWGLDPMQGPRVLGGSELADVQEMADLGAGVRAERLIKSATSVERTTKNGAACVLVEITMTTGRTSRDCYADATGLLVWSSSKRATPMGEVDVVTLYSDYKATNGVSFPMRAVTEMMGQQQIIALEAILPNAPVGDLTTLPAPIAALVRKP